MTNITPIAFAGANAGRISAKRHSTESDSNTFSAVHTQAYILTRLVFITVFFLVLIFMHFFNIQAEPAEKVDKWIGFHPIIQVEDSTSNMLDSFEYEYTTN